MSTKELKNEGKLFYPSCDQGRKKGKHFSIVIFFNKKGHQISSCNMCMLVYVWEETKEKKGMRENTKLEKYFL